MCGLFGYVAKNKKPVDIRRLKDIAETTMLRGPHAWGMAWVDAKGRLKSFKQTGRIVDALGLLAMAGDAQLLIGHCRYATHGDPAVNRNNHPHPAGDAKVVHNGVIQHYRSLVTKHGLRMRTKCDSEVLALLLKKFRGKPINRMARASREAMGETPFAALALWPDRLVATAVNGQPLKIGETPDGFWLASLERGLPGRVSRFPEGSVLEFA
jgi:glucosamine--fructose-6-phosphate aminotransferase (isomerizing)